MDPKTHSELVKQLDSIKVDFSRAVIVAYAIAATVVGWLLW